MTMGSEQYCVALVVSDDMIDNFCATCSLLFIQLSGSSKEADSSFTKGRERNPAIVQGLRDKLVMDLKPCFRYII